MRQPTYPLDAGVSYAETPGIITGMAANWRMPSPLAGGEAGVLVKRVSVGCKIAESHRVVGRAFDLPAGVHATDIAVDQQAQTLPDGAPEPRPVYWRVSSLRSSCGMISTTRRLIGVISRLSCHDHLAGHHPLEGQKDRQALLASEN